MHTFFPVPHKDELFCSILARYALRLGIVNDKVFLGYLCNNRNIIPSALFQGHLKELLNPLKHIWLITPELLANNHTLLPLFKPFLPKVRYQALINDLTSSSHNPFTFRSGVNASLVDFPTIYKICKLCYEEQKSLFGYAFVQRLFQCPGVECCPIHKIFLNETNYLIISSHSHRFTSIGPDIKVNHLHVTTGHEEYHRFILLSEMVEQLLNNETPYISFNQWSAFYQNLARHKNLLLKGRIDHVTIQYKVESLWTKSWLAQQGLNIKGNSNWLVSLFRRHSNSFSYLQHFIVWIALEIGLARLSDLLINISQLPKDNKLRKRYQQSADEPDKFKRRIEWLNQLPENTLKNIRSTKRGRSLYLWLYRYDHSWLMNNKPDYISHNSNKRVNWQKRDSLLARSLLKLFYSIELNLNGPRRTRRWFAKQMNKETLFNNHLNKLKRCTIFFIKYTESVDEYQTRRLARYLSSQIKHNKIIGPLSVIERGAGLSKERSRKPVQEIFKLDIEIWKNLTKCH